MKCCCGKCVTSITIFSLHIAGFGPLHRRLRVLEVVASLLLLICERAVDLNDGMGIVRVRVNAIWLNTDELLCEEIILP